MLPNLWSGDRVAGGVELAIWRAGPDGDPLLCLHGITAQSRAFNALALHLRDSRGVVGVDLRGRGDSDKPGPGSYGLEAHAKDVVRVLDRLGLERATLVGHSMGAFVALKAALSHPERARALVLLDGGWPRVEASPEDISEKRKREAEAVAEGLERAFSRLEMTFESPDDYLKFWFPEQNLKMEDLPPELADYYLYDLEETAEGYRPKASLAAAREDAPQISQHAPTLEEMREVGCPVALVRASQGFFPGSEPLIPDETRTAMAGALDLRSEVILEGANHYTMLWPPYTQQWGNLLRDDSWPARY